ncbi:MAG: GNAT family N-acetyltransferase, partial [Anaerolineae bacterium]|nr:GNAT family N-acetyltransferase [Anaerolineae bacterium]
MTVRTINWATDYEAILDHIHAVYGPEDYDLLAASYGSTPGFSDTDCFVIDGDTNPDTSETEIAAHAMIIERQIQIGPTALPTAEISLLGVTPAYRGRGYEHQLLNVIHERMSDRGDVFGLSFGQPDVFDPWRYEYATGLYLTSYESTITTEQAAR